MKNLRGYRGASGKEKMREAGIPEDAVEKYGDMSEDELLVALSQSIKKSKREGTFDENQIRSFVSMLSPHLSDEQRKKLSAVLSTIDH